MEATKLFEDLIGYWGYLFLAGILYLLFKTTLETIVESIKVFLGNDLNTDDVVSFNGRPARVVRVGVWKTIFFIYDVDCSNGKPIVTGGSKMAIQNDKIKEHIIEKPLPMLDLSRYKHCDDTEDTNKPSDKTD